ncbi:MAG: amidase family protein [Pseudomonadota bacterium]
MTGDTVGLSMGALRRAYAAGTLRPSEVMAQALERLSRRDQEAVWISTADPDRAMAAARSLDARIGEIGALPLYGTVFSVKDNIDVGGFETTAACPAFAYRPDRSATVVARAEAAGALCLGKTNLDQFATGLVGLRSPHGAPRNPHNARYIPGGSSSGAGVSVATGAVSFAFGTDTGGSGRVPASYNAIVGLKPAPGDWSRAGLVYACRSFDTATVFARTLEDALAVDEAVRGPDAADAYSRAVARAPAAPPRVAMVPPDAAETFGDAVVGALYSAAHARAARLFPALAPADLAPFRAINDLMFFGPFVSERDVSVGAFIDAHGEACHPVVRDLIVNSRRFTAADAYRAAYAVEEARRATAGFWQAHDVLVTPTVGALATVAMCEADPLGPNFRNGHYTNFANPLGLAALSIPAGRAADGVPWGITLYAPPERAATLARAAAVFMEDGHA